MRPYQTTNHFTSPDCNDPGLAKHANKQVHLHSRTQRRTLQSWQQVRKSPWDFQVSYNRRGEHASTFAQAATLQVNELLGLAP